MSSVDTEFCCQFLHFDAAAVEEQRRAMRCFRLQGSGRRSVDASMRLAGVSLMAHLLFIPPSHHGGG